MSASLAVQGRPRDKPMLDSRPKIAEARTLNPVTPASVMAAGASFVSSSLSALTI